MQTVDTELPVVAEVPVVARFVEVVWAVAEKYMKDFKTTQNS